MDYAKLIDLAKRRHGMTDYGVAKALKYKNISAIYQIRRGKLGMRAERYRALLMLANGKPSNGSLYIMSTPHHGTVAANEALFRYPSMGYAA